MTRPHVLIDTSIFLLILRIPGFTNVEKEKRIAERLRELIERDALLYLPVTTIIETGNHIGHIQEGNQRRMAADSFVERVMEAIERRAPWQIVPLDKESLRSSLEEFTRLATMKLGLGDALLIKDAERIKDWARNRGEPVYIWTLDEQLRAFSPDPDERLDF